MSFLPPSQSPSFSIQPCPFNCDPSVISPCVFMKYVCFGEYGFMHVFVLGPVSLSAMNEPGRITMQMKQYLIQFPICMESIINQQFSYTCSLRLCVSLSTTTRAVTSATYQSTSPWRGTETSSLTTRPTFKVKRFLCCPSKYIYNRKNRDSPACLSVGNDYLCAVFPLRKKSVISFFDSHQGRKVKVYH